MNRELKFRAWHKVAKNAEPKMTYWSLKQGYGTNTNFFDAAFTKRHGVGAIMQFTGLLDKEGKEIYEGDIVELGTYPNNGLRNVIGEVKYEGCMFHVGNWNMNLCPQEKRTVIGNVHESPELLESR